MLMRYYIIQQFFFWLETLQEKKDLRHYLGLSSSSAQRPPSAFIQFTLGRLGNLSFCTKSIIMLPGHPGFHRLRVLSYLECFHQSISLLLLTRVADSLKAKKKKLG